MREVGFINTYIVRLVLRYYAVPYFATKWFKFYTIIEQRCNLALQRNDVAILYGDLLCTTFFCYVEPCHYWHIAATISAL